MHLFLYDGGEGKVVEELGEVGPDVVRAILPEAFVIEPIHLCDLSALVVASQDGDAAQHPEAI